MHWHGIKIASQCNWKGIGMETNVFKNIFMLNNVYKRLDQESMEGEKARKKGIVSCLEKIK